MMDATSQSAFPRAGGSATFRMPSAVIYTYDEVSLLKIAANALDEQVSDPELRWDLAVSIENYSDHRAALRQRRQKDDRLPTLGRLVEIRPDLKERLDSTATLWCFAAGDWSKIGRFAWMPCFPRRNRSGFLRRCQ